jgi:iron complex transport system substrate-binding protein
MQCVGFARFRWQNPVFRMRPALWLLLALTVGACRDEANGGAARTGAPALDLAPPLAAPPSRVVPATTAAAELVAALLEPARIAALPEQVDRYATRPFDGEGLRELPRFARYVAEPILAARPDLVVTHAWQSQDTTAVLRGEGVSVLVLREGADWESVRASLLALGDVLGATPRARELVGALELRVAALRARAAARPRLLALVYTNDGTGGWAAGSGTTADGVLRLAGLVNAAAEAGLRGHQVVPFERVLELDPDLFVLSTGGGGDGGATERMLTAPGPLAQLAAVRARRFARIDGALLSADSPALVDAAEALEREVVRELERGLEPGPERGFRARERGVR